MNRSKMKDFLQGLNADEAHQVLKTLLDSTPELMKKAYDIAIEIAGNVNADEIMDDVYYKLDTLDVDALYGRSGRTRYGYIDPHDEAWEMFEEALAPFIDEMKKSQQRSMAAATKAYCIGIVKGLWRFEKESNSDFKDWVEDAPAEYIDTVVKEWKKGKPSNEDIAEVMSLVKGCQS